jgi:hypothetical protein
MSVSRLDRRAFHKLAVAALGGIVAGVTGCAKKAPPEASTDKDAHVCRGLNACKGKGKGGANACAGQGACATVAEHTCNGENQCKGLGGCKETAGQNACKGKGECAVPLKDKTWEKARKKFEEAMKPKGKEIGEAPPKS